MSREYKFRAWLKDRKKMVEVEEISFIGQKQIAYTETEYRYLNKEPFYYTQWIDFDEIELMQYTGVPDKNKTDIYEDDILQFDVCSYKYRVYWDKEQCSYKMQNISVGFEWDILDLALFKSHALEVIGNVYENPELLGGTKDE